MRFSGLLLLSLCAAIAGCDKAEDDANALKVGAVSLFDPTATNPSLCAAPAIPFPNNALFSNGANPTTGLTTDTTLNIPSSASTAVAANLTDGWSTTASAFFDVVGLVDYASAAAGIVILEADASPRILQVGVDYTIQPSIAMGQASGTGANCALDAVFPPVIPTNPGNARFLPILQQRSRILIEPLHPLNPSTTYIVAVTKDLLSAGGAPVTPNEFFPVVNSTVAICDRNNSNSDPAILDCSAAGAPADAAARLNAPVLNVMTAPTLNPANGTPVNGATAAAIRMTTLETLRANLQRPTMAAFQSLGNPLLEAASQNPITDDDLVIMWSFTTQSIGATLVTLNAISTAKTFAVANTGVSTGDLGLGLPDVADIWAGTLNAVPYYLDDAASVNDAPSQCLGTVPGVSCNGFWGNNGVVTTPAQSGFVPWTPLADYGTGLGVTPAPCALGAGTPFGWVAPTSTTNCFRQPLERSQENLLVMITVPNVTSGQTKPGNGWPVVIFQHGITGNRTQVLPLAPALAAKGFVVVSIDLPLHGLVPASAAINGVANGGCGATANSSFYVAGAERTFDLDLANNTTGALGVPDTVTDCSGTHFINLGSLITSRDNLRQAVADQIHLIKSLRAANPIDLDGDTNTDDIDETRIHFAGISLGSIVGTTLLGVDTGASATADGSDEAIVAAVLNVPGGGLGKLLDASQTFGPRIAAGLAGVAFSGAGTTGVNSPFEGTDTYETFVRFAQHLVDPGDPINFAVSANANHRILLHEVLNDTVVPNHAASNCPAANALTPGIGNTAADNTLAATRLAACLAGAKLVGSNATTGVACAGVQATGVCTASTGHDETLITGFLSGTEPLYGAMGLTAVEVTPPAQVTTQTCAGLDLAVEFQIGAHSSLLDPTPSAVTFAEMQRQASVYLDNDGGSVGADCP